MYCRAIHWCIALAGCSIQDGEETGKGGLCVPFDSAQGTALTSSLSDRPMCRLQTHQGEYKIRPLHPPRIVCFAAYARDSRNSVEA